MVNVALPTLVRELHATTTQLQWIVDAYSLVFAALPPDRRQPVRPVRPQGHAAGRPGRLRPAASVAGGLVTSPRRPDRRPGSHGPRGGHDVPGHAVDHHQRVHRTQGAGPGHRPVGRHGRCGHRPRADRRRVPARALLVVEHLLRHGPGGRRPASAWSPCASPPPGTRRPSGRLPRPDPVGGVHGWRWCTRSSRRRAYGWTSRSIGRSGSRWRTVLLVAFVAGERRTRPADARRPDLLEPAVQRGQRLGHRRLLHPVRVHLPDRPVHAVRPVLEPAVRRRARCCRSRSPSAIGSVVGTPLAVKVGTKVIVAVGLAAIAVLLPVGGADDSPPPPATGSSPPRWWSSGSAWA